MPTKKTEGEVEAEVMQTDAAVFTKEQILATKRFRNRRDALNVVLESGKSYSLNQVDDLIQKFLKGKVK